MHPLERLINLVALLLESRRPLTFEEIRAVMPAYHQEDAASAKRMFERDKDTLREIGIPVELAATDAWEVEQGYSIPKDRYYLPEIALTPEESWALFVAANAPGQDGEAEQAFHKLSASVDHDVVAWLSERAPAPGVQVSGAHLGVVADALSRKRRIRFRYRPSHGRAGTRQVDPYSLVFRSGNWYLVGLDVVRGEIRSYRLSRLLSSVSEIGQATSPPAGFNGLRYLEAGPWGLGRPQLRARVAFSPKVAWWTISSTPGTEVVRTRGDGWVEMDLPGAESDSFLAWIMSFGADAVVVSPKEMRREVVKKLQAIVSGD